MNTKLFALIATIAIAFSFVAIIDVQADDTDADPIITNVTVHMGQPTGASKSAPTDDQLPSHYRSGLQHVHLGR